MNRIAHAFAATLDKADAPLATDYQLFISLREIYKTGTGLYLRRSAPRVTDYRRIRNRLISAGKIAHDEDYPGAYRILAGQDLPADDIICLVDAFCYISHLSAMQRYGLTDRRPKALYLTVPAAKIIKSMVRKKMEQDYGEDLNVLSADEIHRLNIVHHPHIVRKRPVDIFATVNYGAHMQIEESHVRVSTIGQTFLDMLEEPGRCGGMAHVLDIWEEYAPSHLDNIISAIDGAPKSIHKVRAGYILDEVLKINKPEITKWLDCAQRGGSRVLDPSKPFINRYSEKWMLSINV